MRPAARAALGSLGLLLARLGGRARSIRILYYHSISDDPVRSSVSPGAFAAQMQMLSAGGYHVLSLAEAVDRLAAAAPLPERSVVVTLDDGFRDNYERAFPVLLRFRIPATVFLAAAYIGTDRLPTLTRTAFVPRPLAWEQVLEMQAHGVAFGSHTLTHPMLTRIPADQARREIAGSRRLLEDRLGRPVEFFCYPRGDMDGRVAALVREAGYRAACSTAPGVNLPATDRYALRRTYVSPEDTPAEFAKRLAGAYDTLQRAQRLIRRLRERKDFSQ